MSSRFVRFLLATNELLSRRLSLKAVILIKAKFAINGACLLIVQLASVVAKKDTYSKVQPFSAFLPVPLRVNSYEAVDWADDS